MFAGVFFFLFILSGKPNTHGVLLTMLKQGDWLIKLRCSISESRKYSRMRMLLPSRDRITWICLACVLVYLIGSECIFIVSNFAYKLHISYLPESFSSESSHEKNTNKIKLNPFIADKLKIIIFRRKYKNNINVQLFGW